MRERGDWLRPTFNGQPCYHKPVLIYWLMRGGYAIGGDNPFGARLVSGFAGDGDVPCWSGGSAGRSPVGPSVGLLGKPSRWRSAPIMVAESKLATTDATLALLIVAARGASGGSARRDSNPPTGGRLLDERWAWRRC